MTSPALGTKCWKPGRDSCPSFGARTGVFELQVMSEGGPQPQSIIHFSVSNETVAVVNRRGQVTGKVVGTAVLQGTIQTVNEDTGKVTVFSQVPSLCSTPAPPCGAPAGRRGRRGSPAPENPFVPSAAMLLTRLRKYMIFGEEPTRPMPWYHHKTQSLSIRNCLKSKADTLSPFAVQCPE